MPRKYHPLPKEQFDRALIELRRERAVLDMQRQLAAQERAGQLACELALAARRGPVLEYAI